MTTRISKLSVRTDNNRTENNGALLLSALLAFGIVNVSPSQAETPAAPPPSNALTAPSNKTAQSKSPVLSAPAAAENKAAGAISQPTATDKPISGAISAPSGAAPAGTAPAITAPSNSAPDAAADPGLSVKKSLFHDLTMKNIRAKKEFGIKVEISNIEELCLKQASSVAECRKAVDETGDRIDSKVNEAEKLRTQQQSLELQQQNNELQAERNRIAEEGSTVVVVNPGLHPRRDIVDPIYGNGGTVITGTSGYGVSGTVTGPNGSLSVQTGGSTIITQPGVIVDNGSSGEIITHPGTPARPPTVSPPGPFVNPRTPSALPTPRR